jgi:hypothetical protein
MIPLSVDHILRKMSDSLPCAEVTEVTRATSSTNLSNHAGKQPFTAVTHAHSQPGNMSNTPEVGAPDSATVTRVTQGPPAWGNSPIASQRIAIERVSNAVTQVTLQQEERAMPQDSSMLHDRASYSLQGQTSEIPQTAPCMESWRSYCCANSRRWRSRYGVLICGTCHPPADVALVAGWEAQNT